MAAHADASGCADALQFSISPNDFPPNLQSLKLQELLSYVVQAASITRRIDGEKTSSSRTPDP
jgi:hypothetical protein